MCMSQLLGLDPNSFECALLSLECFLCSLHARGCYATPCHKCGLYFRVCRHRHTECLVALFANSGRVLRKSSKGYTDFVYHPYTCVHTYISMYIQYMYNVHLLIVYQLHLPIMFY